MREMMKLQPFIHLVSIINNVAIGNFSLCIIFSAVDLSLSDDLDSNLHQV